MQYNINSFIEGTLRLEIFSFFGQHRIKGCLEIPGQGLKHILFNSQPVVMPPCLKVIELIGFLLEKVHFLPH